MSLAACADCHQTGFAVAVMRAEKFFHFSLVPQKVDTTKTACKMAH